MKRPIHRAIDAILRRLDTMQGQPFGGPASSGRLRVGDLFQRLDDRGNLVTLFAKAGQNLLNIHIDARSLQNRARPNPVSVQYCSSPNYTSAGSGALSIARIYRALRLRYNSSKFSGRRRGAEPGPGLARRLLRVWSTVG